MILGVLWWRVVLELAVGLAAGIAVGAGLTLLYLRKHGRL
jgi:hypothetical protein